MIDWLIDWLIDSSEQYLSYTHEHTKFTNNYNICETLSGWLSDVLIDWLIDWLIDCSFMSSEQQVYKQSS